MIPSATELLHALDAERPRTQQQEMGMSALGSCRRRAGYQAQGYPPDPEWKPDNMQAILGTAIHEALAAAARLALPGAEPEALEVSFGGLVGHPDLYYLRTLRDYKTLGYSMQLEQRRQLGPKTGDRWQAHTYAAGMILAGWPVETVEIDYIARDSGDEYLFAEPFSIALVREAMDWLNDVRTAPIELLPRDFRPDTVMCKSCRFFRRCWDAEPGTDDRHVLFADMPHAAEWADLLADAQARRKQAERDEKDAKGALDTLRTVERPGQSEDFEVPGLEGRVVRFSVHRGKTSPDMARIAIDYKNAGKDESGAYFRPPMRYGDPVIKVAVVKPREPK